MTTTVRLPRILAEAVNSDLTFEVQGETLREALDSLFDRKPGLRNHLMDESGAIRPHVSLFVDRIHADLDSPVHKSSEIRILHAVSGG